MGNHRATGVTLRSRMVNTEIDFALILVKVCQVELALGDAVRAEHALSEARGISDVISTIVETRKMAVSMRQKYRMLTGMITAANKAVLKARTAVAALEIGDRFVNRQLANRVPVHAAQAASGM